MNNKIFEKYVIFKQAYLDDKSRIINFYRKFWEENHLIFNNEYLFEYEFVQNQKLNFIYAEDKDSKKLLSVVGYYQYNNNQSSFKNHICGSISRVHPECEIPFLGIETLNRLKLITKSTSYCGTNTNSETMLPLCKRYLKHNIGEMNHFYLLNLNLKKYNLCSIKKYENKLFDLKINKKFDIKQINWDYDFEKIFNNIRQSFFQPYKSKEYILKRYKNHPIYKYDLYALNFGKKTISLFILRKQIFKDSSILRFIDYFGEIENFKYLGNLLQEKINSTEHEYLDLITNMPPEILIASKFNEKSIKEDLIPHYFEPFVKKI